MIGIAESVETNMPTKAKWKKNGKGYLVLLCKWFPFTYTIITQIIHNFLVGLAIFFP